jgi:hypothetical protein
MLRRALERIIQLYTDKSHFVYELLQNAEDAGAKSIKFIQYADRLEVFHDGKPFTKQNLISLCDIGLSDKTDDYNKIGEFGVGFKSVFGICETVKLYSEPANYRDDNVPGALRFAKKIVDFVKPCSIDFEELPKSYTTRFVFPYTVGKSFSGYATTAELKDVLSSKLQDLGITTLLFMKSLEMIEYRIEVDNNVKEGQYLLEKNDMNSGRFQTGMIPAFTPMKVLIPWMLYHGSGESGFRNDIWNMIQQRGVGGLHFMPKLCVVMAAVGVEDLAYITTLRAMISQALKSKVPARAAAAKEAQEVLDSIKEAIKPSVRYYYANGYWKSEVFNQLRQIITTHILTLKKLEK